MTQYRIVDWFWRKTYRIIEDSNCPFHVESDRPCGDWCPLCHIDQEEKIPEDPFKPMEPTGRFLVTLHCGEARKFWAFAPERKTNKDQAKAT